MNFLNPQNIKRGAHRVVDLMKWAVVRRSDRHRVMPCSISKPAEKLRSQFQADLQDLGIDFFLGGSGSSELKRVSVKVEDAKKTFRVLARLAKRNSDAVFFDSDQNIITPAGMARRFAAGTPLFNIGLVISREKIDWTRLTACHVSFFELTFWKMWSKDSSDEKSNIVRIPSEVHSVLGRVRDGSIPADADAEDYASETTLLGNPQFPIDVVYTWVDSTDPEWAEARDAHSDTANTTGGNKDHRFRNRDELRYSLRSIEMYAPFVRHVFLVTAGQVPEWLNTENSRLTVVDHKEIFEASDALPNFNSTAIECRLYNIKGLSEHHLYLNDDFFFGRPARPEQYFAPNGISKFFPGRDKIIPEVAPDELEEYIAADENVVHAFREKLNFRPTALMLHAPYAVRTSVMLELKNNFPEMFARCCANRFRHATDVRAYAFMYPHFANFVGRAVQGDVSNRYISLGSPNLENQLRALLIRRNWDTFCLNDVVGENSLPNATVDKLVSDFLNHYLPMASSFEK